MEVSFNLGLTLGAGTWAEGDVAGIAIILNFSLHAGDARNSGSEGVDYCLNFPGAWKSVIVIGG